MDTSAPGHIGTLWHYDTLYWLFTKIKLHTHYTMFISIMFSVNKRFQCRAIPQFFVVISVYIYSHESSLLLLMSS